MNTCGAEVLVANLKAQGVKHVFGVPGAKIDRVNDALLNSGIETVVCRHEQNASFIAAGLGKLTGKAGVCLVTSGPGCTNLSTGFATANSEGMPIVGLGGDVPRAQRLKQVHQSLDTVALFKPITKYSPEVGAPEAIGEVLAGAFRAAESGRSGAAFISLPMDIMTGAAPNIVLAPVRPQELGAGPTEAIAVRRPANQPGKAAGSTPWNAGERTRERDGGQNAVGESSPSVRVHLSGRRYCSSIHDSFICWSSWFVPQPAGGPTT
jgi:acetolactate synthase-1/2/3 large subunit